MKRIIVLLLVAALSRSLYAFSLSVGSNHVKVSQTTTVTVGDISGSPTSYEWSANIGSISGSGASVTFTAPAGKGKATISITVKNGSTTLWSGTVQVLVYKTIIVLKCDDYWYCDWNSPTYIRPNWILYLDYMCNVAHVKTSIEMVSSSLEPTVDVNGAFATATKAYLNTGYLEILSHGYNHDCHATKSVATLDSEFQLSESLAQSKLGISLRGWDWPGACSPPVSDNVVTALNNAPAIAYAYFVDPPYVDNLTKFSFQQPQTRLVLENSNFTLDYNGFLNSYAANKDRAVNVIQTHPVWWDAGGVALNVYKQVIAYLQADGATIIFPYDYVRMLNEPAFVPDEGPAGGPTDTTPPGAPAAVRDGISETDDPYTYSTTQLSANWDAATDPDGPITAYLYAIGTTAGGTQTVNWTTLGNVLSVTKTGLTLTAGATYYFSVKAQSAGGTGVARNSNGQYVQTAGTGDTTPPGAPAAVRDGTGVDIDSINSTNPMNPITQLSANWDAATDQQGPITQYQYAIGTAQGATNITNGWLSNGTNLTVTKTGLTLTVGQAYYFSVRAVSAGGTGTAANSNGQTVTGTGTTTPSGTYPNPYSLSSPGGMKFVVSGQTEGEIKIYTMSGKLVRTLTGANEISWDGANEDGEKVKAGVYLYTITLSDGEKITGKIGVTR